MTTCDGPQNWHKHDNESPSNWLKQMKQALALVGSTPVQEGKEMAIEKKMKLFEYVIVWRFIQKSDDKEDKERLEILVPPKLAVARDEKEVLMLASKDIPEKYDLSEVEVIIRPF